VGGLAWNVKRPEFEKQKCLVINYSVALSDTWDEAATDARAKDLADVATRIWPAPERLLSRSD
jgi:hypothetical protein